MQKRKRSTAYKKVYFDFFGYDEGDFIPCEICEKGAVDIHHIKADGMGGTTQKPKIENLMALCRSCHIQFGDITELRDKLTEIHLKKMENNGYS